MYLLKNQVVQVPHVSRIGIRIGERKLIDLVLTIEAKGKTENVVILMLNGFVVIDLS